MTEDPPPPASSGDSSPSPFSSPWFISSVGFVTALVVMGLVITTVQLVGDDTGGDSVDTTQAQASAEGYEGGVGEEEYRQDPTASAAPGDHGSRSVCGLPAGEQTEFTAWPGDTEWKTVGTTEAPSSGTHGPGRIKEETGFRHCYAKTPAGAVIAATNFAAMGGDPQIAPDLVEHVRRGHGQGGRPPGTEGQRTG